MPVSVCGVCPVWTAGVRACMAACRYACYLTLLKKIVRDTERLEVPMFFGEGMTNC